MTIIWDWNGTLLDDVHIAVETDNETFARFGLPAITLDTYQKHFRHPVADFYAELGVPQELFPQVADAWMPIYERLSLGCPLRKDAAETIHRFREAGFHQAIVSASPLPTLLRQVERYPELNGLFDGIEGLGDAYGASKVALARGYLDRNGITEAVFIGDTTHDAEVAAAASCRCMLVQGGHQAPSVLTSAGLEVYAGLREIADVLLSSHA